MSADQPFPSIAQDAASTDCVDRVIRYHLQTKHHFNRYARSLGSLDWANQPDPFRRFTGSPLNRLPLLKPHDDPQSPSYDALFEQEGTGFHPVTVTTMSRFLELALALSAWKQAGDSRWALRTNPSSGNLHPTEGYVIVPELDGLDLKAGLYHYAPKEHGLELRAECDVELVARLLRPFPPSSFLIGLSSVHWREAWKYGERAFRYCNHDIGHAIGTARFAAAALGWRMVLLDGMDQASIGTLLGTDRRQDFSGGEAEHPECIAAIWPSRESTASIPLFLDVELIRQWSETQWHGRANRLSRDNPVPWEIIDDAAVASWKTSFERGSVAFSGSRNGMTTPESLHASRTPDSPNQTAAQIIRQRRSAVAFDGKTSISVSMFYRMMSRVMPRIDREQFQRSVPWDVLPWDPIIHLLLFIHRVDGLSPGLYLLGRDPAQLSFIRNSMNPDLEWTAAPGCPEDLPLYWLLEGDARRLAGQVSCHQDIAGDSAFSLGMLARFEERLRQGGAWWYPRMFWEAGLLGQVLYLEAEAAGVRATGIGCFFDDPVHEIVGIKGLTLQSLYHFTVGGPVEDVRLTTLPPYRHTEQ